LVNHLNNHAVMVLCNPFAVLTSAVLSQDG